MVPSSAVTTTVTVLLPVTNPVVPVITRVAAESVGVAMTVTEVVPLATLSDVPAVSTLVPLILNSESVLTVESTGVVPV